MIFSKCVAFTLSFLGPAWRQTIFYPFAHTSQYARGMALDLAVKSPLYSDQEFGDVPLLEAVGTWDEQAGILTILAVNRDLEYPLALEGDGRDFAGYHVQEQIIYTHPDLKARNSAEHPNQVAPHSLVSATFKDGKLAASLPPASWNVIRLAKT